MACSVRLASIHASVRAAINFIDQIPFGIILAHQREVKPIFEKLRKVVEAPEPSTVSPFPNIPLPKPEKTSPEPTDQETSLKPVLALLQNLDKKQEKITKYLSLSEFDTIGGSSSTSRDDPRVHDLAPSKDEVAAYRKALNQRSLAFGYEDWELTNFGSSKIQELLVSLTETQMDRLPRVGRVTEYVGNPKHCFNDEKKKEVIDSIRHGIKLLVFERLTKKSITSAVLSFSYTSLRNLQYKDLPLLEKMLYERPWISEILTREEDWYQRCQQYYDNKEPIEQYFSSQESSGFDAGPSDKNGSPATTYQTNSVLDSSHQPSMTEYGQEGSFEAANLDRLFGMGNIETFDDIAASNDISMHYPPNCLAFPIPNWDEHYQISKYPLENIPEQR